MPYIELRNVSFSRKMEVEKHGYIPIAPSRGRQGRNRDVLTNISLNIQNGERIGLLGPNGAGKTTLLRLMSGIFRPDSGTIDRAGDVSTFFDGGFGLDPQLTGRANCVSRAIMARIRGDESEAMVSWVEAFAELGEYFDQPIRTYSTGMIMRLVFAIGTAQSHQILLIDEGLGTADAYFQEKALARLKEMYQTAPIMVLASHNSDLLKQHCQRGIVIQDAHVAFDGSLDDACSFYENPPKI